MKSLILAAGVGDRLKELTRMTNKCCIKVGDKSIIRSIVDNLFEKDIDDIVVVTGHHSGRVEEELGQRVKYLYNPLYNSSGILVSSWLAKEHFKEHPFILSMGDHFFHHSILDGLLETQGDVIIGVRKKETSPRDVKVVIDGDKIKMFEIDLPVQEATGQFGMIIYFKNPEVSRRFFETNEKFLSQGHHKVRLIDVLNNMINQGIKFTPYYFTDEHSIEIETYEDLQKARELDKKFKDA